MKGVKAPEYIRKFIPKKSGNIYKVRFFHEPIGDMPIGARLSKGNLPNLAREAGTIEEAEVLCEEWNQWLKSDKSIPIYGSRKKRSSSQR